MVRIEMISRSSSSLLRNDNRESNNKKSVYINYELEKMAGLPTVYQGFF